MMESVTPDARLGDDEATYSSDLSPSQHELGLRQYALLDGGGKSARVVRLRLVKQRGGRGGALRSV